MRSRPFSFRARGYGAGMTKVLFPLALFALAACNGDPGSTAGGITPDEARALEEAAEMVESRRLPEAVISPVPLDGAKEAAAPKE